ncbi:hypothetical protein EIQ03_05280 [Xanthomonas campestris pv. raphani]
MKRGIQRSGVPGKRLQCSRASVAGQSALRQRGQLRRGGVVAFARAFWPVIRLNQQRVSGMWSAATGCGCQKRSGWPPRLQAVDHMLVLCDQRATLCGQLRRDASSRRRIGRLAATPTQVLQPVARSGPATQCRAMAGNRPPPVR